MEALGFDTVWLTEHHFIDDDYLPSVLTMAAAVAARTSRVTIGTAVLLLPLHDPIRVAEDAAVVDVLSDGRLRLGLGIGYKLEEFEAFGVDRRARPSLLEEGIEIIRGAWADGPFSHHGRHRSFDDLDVTPKPVQRPGPQIWLAGRAPVPVARAATVGDGLIVVGGPDLYREYHDGPPGERAGRPGAAVHLRLHVPERRPRALRRGPAQPVRDVPDGELRPVVRQRPETWRPTGPCCRRPVRPTPAARCSSSARRSR